MVRPGSPLRDFSAPLNALQGEFNRLVENYWPAWAPGPHHVASEDRPAGAWIPAVDVYETADELVVLADLPGVHPSAIQLSVDGRVLTLRGEKPAPGGPSKAESDQLRERRFGPFLRHITLPTEVNVDAVRADFRLGVLEVRLPKAEEARTRRIPIQPS
jgi:HSP20 family protein